MAMPAITEPFGEQFASENAVLDLISHALDTGIALGLAPQIRARLAHHAELAPPAPQAPPASEAPQAQSADLTLRAASGASVLRALAKTRRSEPGRAQLEAIAALLSGIATSGGTPT